METSDLPGATTGLQAGAPDVAELAGQLPLVVYRCQPALSGRLLYLSPGGDALLGCQPGDELGAELTYGDLIWLEDQSTVAAELAAARQAARPYQCHYRLQPPAGERRWVVDTGRFVTTAQSLVREGIIVALPVINEPVQVQAERSRLARELHDSVTQSLYSVTLFAEAGRHLAESGAAERASQYFQDVLDTSRQALREMRLLVHKLRPSILAEVGLVRALQQRLNAVEGRTGVKHELQASPDLDLNVEQEEVLYHIAQEALNNALKHATARAVSVTLTQVDTHVQMIVTDDGAGFDMDQAIEGGGLGLISMQERAVAIGGQVTFATAPQAGTTISVTLPLAYVPEQHRGAADE